jgi:hypothetical protein
MHHSRSTTHTRHLDLLHDDIGPKSLPDRRHRAGRAQAGPDARKIHSGYGRELHRAPVRPIRVAEISDVSAFDVCLCGITDCFDVTLLKQLDWPAPAKGSITRSQPLTNALLRECFSEDENDLAEIAKSLIIVGTDSRGSFPVSNGSYGGASSLRDGRLGEAIVAKASHYFADLNGPVETLHRIC